MDLFDTVRLGVLFFFIFVYINRINLRRQHYYYRSLKLFLILMIISRDQSFVLNTYVLSSWLKRNWPLLKPHLEGWVSFFKVTREDTVGLASMHYAFTFFYCYGSQNYSTYSLSLNDVTKGISREIKYVEITQLLRNSRNRLLYSE